MSENLCRCGRDIPVHLCHWANYTCTAEGTSRFVTRFVCLAGVNPKLGAYETFACDEHWEKYNAKYG